MVLDDEAGRGGVRFGGALGEDSDDDLPPPSSPRAAAAHGAAPAPATAGAALTALTDGLRAFMAADSNLLDGIDVRGGASSGSVDSDDDLAPPPALPGAGAGAAGGELNGGGGTLAELMRAMDLELRQRDAASDVDTERARGSLGRSALQDGGEAELLEALLASHAEGLASGVVGPLAALAAELGVALPAAGRADE